MTDQQRGDTVLDSSPCKTPNIDRFKAEGVTFSEAFCPSPHCCPSRATFFTGLYPSQHGIWHNVNVANARTRELKPGVRLWSENLAASGYELSFSGKWHVSAKTDPSDHGWMENRATAVDNAATTDEEYVRQRWRRIASSEQSSEPGSRQRGEILRPGYGKYVHYGVRDKPFGDHAVVDAAISALSDRKGNDRPWCQFVGPVGPHDPYFAPQRFIDMYNLDDISLPASFEDRMADKPGFYRRTRSFFDQLSPEEHREAILHYYAFCSYEDELFGTVLDALDATGQAENTVVMYLSDHGDYAGEHGLWCKGLPAFRGAYHVPAIIRWPAGIQNPGRTCDELVSLADFAPTVLELCDITADYNGPGASLVPYFNGDIPSSWRDTLYTQTNGNELYGIQRGVFTKRWKYVFNGFDYDELYDLAADPFETENLAERPESDEMVKSMCRKMWTFAYSSGDGCINPYIMVGFAPLGPGSVTADELTRTS